MCGRYRLSRRKELLAEYFHVNFDDLDWEPRYNLAPTQSVPVIRRYDASAKPRASMLRWGLVPSWSSDAVSAAQNINARSETAATKPSFRDPLRKQRCLIPADGFYEWKRTGKARQPYCFEVNSGELFAFAGIWDLWRDRSGAMIESCSILTTIANPLTSTVHDRMPVILQPQSYGLWLEPAMQELQPISELLRPYDAAQMRCFPVSVRVNHVANDDEGCSLAVTLGEKQPDLFS